MVSVYTILGIALVAVAVGVVYYFLIYDRGNVFERAIMLAEQGNYVDARGIIRTRIDRDPDNTKAHFYLSRIYAIEGNEEQEMDHLKEIKRINRYMAEVKAVDVITRIAQIYYKQDMLSESFENYLEVLHHDAVHEQALAHIAFMAAGQEAYQVANRFFMRLIRVAGDAAEYHIAHGICQSMEGNIKDAIESLQMAVNLEPSNQTAIFLHSMLAFRNGQPEKSKEYLDKLLPLLQDPVILHIARKLATAVEYLLNNYARALSNAEQCLATATEEQWVDEEYDGHMNVAYMAMFTGDLDKSNEHLLELEIRNPADQAVLKVSDFRLDLEEQVATIDQVSPRGFDFLAHMQDWVRGRFPDTMLYGISGLKQELIFDVMGFFTGEGEVKRSHGKDDFDPTDIINRFNALKGDVFNRACESLIAAQGYKIKNQLKLQDRDGADYIAQSVNDKSVLALFRIRKWSNQPISDIFLREQQNYMNELKVQHGYVVAGAELTAGAETALQNLNKISVVNDVALGELLLRILK